MTKESLKQKTEEAIENTYSDQLNKIKNSAESGNYSTHIDNDDMTDQLEYYLESKGFFIERKRGNPASRTNPNWYYIVSWGKIGE